VRELIFPSVTAVVAVIGVYLSGRQIRISNKQHLFDRRLKSWLIVKGLLDLFGECRSVILTDEGSSPLIAIDLDFMWLTNDSYLEEITASISAALDSPEHTALLYKLEEMKSLSVEFTLLFAKRLKHNDAPEREISHFILLYQTLLFRMYQYEVILRNMRTHTEKFSSTIAQAQIAVGERGPRERVMQTFRSMEESYKNITSENFESKIITEIRL
jgi:hypothetical protein